MFSPTAQAEAQATGTDTHAEKKPALWLVSSSAVLGHAAKRVEHLHLYPCLGRPKPSVVYRHALKCRRSAPRLPRRDQPRNVTLGRLRRINVQIVLRETMHGVKVPASLSEASVTPIPFSTLQLRQRASAPRQRTRPMAQAAESDRPATAPAR